ncbi:RNA polymerase sigma factor [Erysipelothrix anatis]|nr:sigma-70 family RNA polymerase sigma factor [Erysipelothrix anatis]
MKRNNNTTENDWPYTETGTHDFESLYNQTIRAVYYIIRRLIRNQHTVEDLVQDTYLKAFKKIDSLEVYTVANFAAWINQIALNNAKDFLKKNKPVLFSEITREEDVDFEVEDTDTFTQPDESANQAEISEIIQNIMDSLPEDQRLCTFLFYYEDMTIREIAAYLELSESTIKSRLKYAKDKIRKKITEHENNGITFFSIAPIGLFVYALKMMQSQAPVPPYTIVAADGIAEGVSAKSQKPGHVAKVIVTVGVVSTIAAFAIIKYPKPPITPVVENKVSFDPFAFVSISFNGDSTLGTASLQLVGAPESLTTAAYSISKSSELTNGDVIKVRFGHNDFESNYAITTLEKSYTVTGLEEPNVINPFEAIHFITSGEDGSGSIDAVWNTESPWYPSHLDGINIMYSKSESLANGDQIDVLLTNLPKSEKYYNQTTIKITVQGLTPQISQKPTAIPQPPKPEPDFDPYIFVKNEMTQSIADRNIPSLLSMFSKDYYGNTLNPDEWTSYTHLGQSISVGKRDNQYIGYAEMYLQNRNGDWIQLSIVSSFNEDFNGKYSLYAASLDSTHKLEAFKALHFGDVTILTN